MLLKLLELSGCNRVRKIFFLIVCFFFLSAYPIYKNYINGEAIATYQLYRGVIEKRSKFYNPWQYRILCPLIIEGTKRLYDVTIDKIFPIEKNFSSGFRSTSGFASSTEIFIQQLKDPNVLKYLIIFICFRFFEDFVILVLAYFLLKYFIKSRWLILTGLILISWSMGNGVSASDLTFNTYLDNILYLLAGCIILYRQNPWYILPITIIGCANRETSLLIPYLFFVSNLQFKYPVLSKNMFTGMRFPSRKVFIITSISFISFALIFIGIRAYFGYQPQGIWKVPAGLPMLKLNLFSVVAVKGYFEMFGAFSIIPLICIYKFRQCSEILQLWFVVIVPIWFLVHFYSVPSYESRLFFVPTYLIFIPMLLEIIQKYEGRGNKLENKNSVPTMLNIPE